MWTTIWVWMNAAYAKLPCMYAHSYNYIHFIHKSARHGLLTDTIVHIWGKVVLQRIGPNVIFYDFAQLIHIGIGGFWEPRKEGFHAFIVPPLLACSAISVIFWPGFFDQVFSSVPFDFSCSWCGLPTVAEMKFFSNNIIFEEAVCRKMLQGRHLPLKILKI